MSAEIQVVMTLGPRCAHRVVKIWGTRKGGGARASRPRLPWWRWSGLVHSSLIRRHRPLGLLAAMESLCKFWSALWMLKCWTCFRIWFDTGCSLTVGCTLAVGCALTVNRKTYLDSWGTCHVPEGYPPTCIYLYNKKCVGKAVEQLDQGSLLHRFIKVLLITITMSMTTLTMMTMMMTSFMAY